jgi:hypothetical protein
LHKQKTTCLLLYLNPYQKGQFMKKILWAGAAGLLMTLPGITKASVLTFEISGSQYELLFNPQGSGSSNLPGSCFYRSYNCVIGSKPVYPTIIFTPAPPPPPPKGGNTNPGGKTPGNPNNNNPPNPGGNNNPPPNNVPTNPPGGNNNPPDNGGTDPTGGGNMGGGGCDPAAVPLPDPAAMSGIGLAGTAIFRWFRSRKAARA